MTKRLYDLAYGRSGDKGNIANISVIARNSAAYAEIKAKLTAERVKAHLGDLVRGEVIRYEAFCSPKTQPARAISAAPSREKPASRCSSPSTSRAENVVGRRLSNR